MKIWYLHQAAFALLIPDLPASCANWPEFDCRAQVNQGPCGEYCPETDQCLETTQVLCPFDEAPMPKRADCHKILDPATCLAAMHSTGEAIICAGFCVKTGKSPTDGVVTIDWDSGLCLNLYEICPEKSRQMIIRLNDVPCNVRTQCHACYQNIWTATDKGEPDCVYDAGARACRDRTADDAQASYHVGLCDDPRGL